MQSGKTEAFIDQINTDKFIREKVLFIVFCSNNLFLTQQTSNRVQSGTELKSIIFSSENKQCRTYTQISKQFQNYGVILCCSNKTRFGNIISYLTN